MRYGSMLLSHQTASTFENPTREVLIKKSSRSSREYWRAWVLAQERDTRFIRLQTSADILRAIIVGAGSGALRIIVARELWWSSLE